MKFFTVIALIFALSQVVSTHYYPGTSSTQQQSYHPHHHHHHHHPQRTSSTRSSLYNPSGYDSNQQSSDDSGRTYSNSGRSSDDNTRSSDDNSRTSSYDNGQSSDNSGRHNHHHHHHHHPHHTHHRHPIHRSTRFIAQNNTADKAQSKHASGSMITRNTQSVVNNNGIDSYRNAFKTKGASGVVSRITTTHKRQSAASSVINDSSYAGVNRQNGVKKNNKVYHVKRTNYADGASNRLHAIHSKVDKGAAMSAVETRSFRGLNAQSHNNKKYKDYVNSKSTGPNGYKKSQTNVFTTKGNQAAVTSQVSTHSYQGQNGQSEANTLQSKYFHKRGQTTDGTLHSLINTHKIFSHQATLNSVVLTPGQQTARAQSENTQQASKYFRNLTSTANGSQNSKLAAINQRNSHVVANAKTITSNSAEQNAQEHTGGYVTLYQSGAHN